MIPRIWTLHGQLAQPSPDGVGASFTEGATSG